MSEPQYSLPKKIDQNENISIKFSSYPGTLCAHKDTVLNTNSIYNLYENLSPANPTYLSVDDINNSIKFLNNSLIGSDFKSCKLTYDTILPLVGNNAIVNLHTAVKYCTILKDKCMGVTSIDGLNVYWNLISSLDMNNKNYNLIKDFKTTYLQDGYDLYIEKFDQFNQSSLNCTDELMIVFIVGILICVFLTFNFYIKKL
jgi:hypothetical protein